MFDANLCIQVYTIEVQDKEVKAANRLLMDYVTHEEYIAFRMQHVNQKAFNNAIPATAQFHSTLRTIVINQVSEESYFVLENQVGAVNNLLGVYHLIHKESMCLIVKTRKEVKELMKEWTLFLNPSDTRLTGVPTLLGINRDDYSEDTMTQMSVGIESLLSLDMTEFTIFHPSNPTSKTGNDRPISEVTLNSTEATIQIQQAEIKRQGQQTADLLHTIQEMKEDINTKIDKMLAMIAQLTRTAASSSEVNPTSGKTATKQRP
jgi:urease gamma subunit